VRRVDFGHRFPRSPYATKCFASEFKRFSRRSACVNSHTYKTRNIKEVNTKPAETVMKCRGIQTFALMSFVPVIGPRAHWKRDVMVPMLDWNEVVMGLPQT
jgi:hypothetical protein